MPETTTSPVPTIAEVDAIDKMFGSAMSDLDWLADRFERMDGATMEYAAQMEGIEPPKPELLELLEPTTFARVLVFAREAIDDADSIRADAERLERALLSIYRTNVIEQAQS